MAAHTKLSKPDGRFSRPSGLNRTRLEKSHFYHGLLGRFAPEFGWKHKEFMRSGSQRILSTFRNRLHVFPWSWRVTPQGGIERATLDEKRIDATLKEAAELSYAWFDKMAIKPSQIHRNLSKATALWPSHQTGTARAGANREISVCSSDFECHDIDHLFFVSAASLPRTTFNFACVPTAIGAAYAWRRILENHFSRGSSTRFA